MKRMILGILAGFVITAVLSTVTDHIFHLLEIYPPYGQPMFDNGLLLLALAYRAVYTVFGCYIMSMIAKDKAMKAAIIIGSIGTVLWLAGGYAMRDMGPAWYTMGAAVLGLPESILGAKLYQWKSKRSEQTI